MKQKEFSMIREELDRIFDDACFVDGLPAEEINQQLMLLYEEDTKKNVPFALTRAKLLDHTLQNMRIAVNPCGKFAGVVERSSLSGRYPFTSAAAIIRNIRQHSIMEKEFPDILEKCHKSEAAGLAVSTLDLSHTVPDWERLLTLGVCGILEEAKSKYEKTSSLFYESVILAYTAFRSFILRFARICGEHDRKDLAAILEKLAYNKPETLQEALQLAILYFHVQEIEGEWLRSFGLFDRLYFPFYEHDLANGTADEEKILELLLHFFAFFHSESKGKDPGCAITFGGLKPDDEEKDLSNDLTFLAWKAFAILGNPTPKFSLRCNKYTPEKLLDLAANCIQEGKNSMVFANEEIARKAFIKQGKDKEDLANFVPVGCYEPAIMGKELSCTMTCDYNLAKGVQWLFEKPSFHPESYEEVEKAYFSFLEKTLKETMEHALYFERIWERVNPSPILSGTMFECMQNNKDVSNFGTKYCTSGVMCAGLGTAVDSLMAIKNMVFERKMLSFDSFREILEKNWEGAEDLRQYAMKRPQKWGCGDPEADLTAEKICRMAANLINNTKNAKGNTFQMGLWSIYFCLIFGSKMKATADGRLAGSTLSKNSGATAGCDRQGIAGLFESLAKLDHSQFPDGAILDVMLPQSTAKGEEGASFIKNLVKTFFANGGMFIHFNILSLEELKDAQIHPEKYRNLQVRLCGWNVRFIDLSKEHQNWLIHEAQGK